MLTSEKVAALQEFATQIRIECLKMISCIGVGHVGGSLSIADLLAVLYGEVMNIDPKNPKWIDRDRIILSKGHAGPAMYAALGLKGFFPQEELLTLNQPGTSLPSHTDMNRTPGVDMTTGSLGQGSSSAVGIALACKLAGRSNYTYLIIGDGETQEGQVWEAAIFASAKDLDHLIAFVDNNKKQVDTTVDEVMGKPQFVNKFRSFNWNAIYVEDGHDVEKIWDAIQNAHQFENGKPTAIILHTVKGKGWKLAEELEYNHALTVTAEQAQDFEAACKMKCDFTEKCEVAS